MKRHRKFEKYGARAVFTAALLCFLLTWAACKGPENSGTDEESIPSETGSSVTEGTEAYSEETVTESAYSGPVPVIRAVSPEGEIDVVPQKARNYIDLASEAYASSDLSATVRIKGEAFDEISPVRFYWTVENPGEVNEIEEYELVLSESEDLSDPVVRPCTHYVPGAETETESLYNLKTGTTYYWRIRALLPDGTYHDGETKSFTTKAGPRILYIPGVKNARDAGGWSNAGKGTLQQGLVYRSAKLEEADASGVRIMTEELGIRTEIDLRDPKSEEVLTSLDPETVNVLNISGYSYTSFLSKTTQAGEAIRVFSDPDSYPILVHCAGGADRTGALMYVLKAYAGCPETELLMDYELTTYRFVTGYVTEDHNFDFPAFYAAFQKLTGKTPAEKAETFLLMTGISVMEASNVKALLTGTGAVFQDPPKSRVRAIDGKVTFSIDQRNAGAVASVQKGEEKLPFTYEEGELTVSVSGSGDGVIVFEDGSKLKFNWR